MSSVYSNTLVMILTEKKTTFCSAMNLWELLCGFRQSYMINYPRCARPSEAWVDALVYYPSIP